MGTNTTQPSMGDHSRSMIPVTQAFLPPIEEYTAILSSSWNRNWITNRGPLLLDLEEKLKNYLGINYITITTNGTIPLQIAIKTLDLKGEIITTPFSYVATTASIVWENCTPVFVDIDEKYLTIDETKIEAAITEKTSAILATHVFGNPCNVEEIEKIAQKFNLKVIYDAAHCFGIKYKDKSIFNYGDISTCSFHATKIFHTGEGGAMICNSADLHDRLFYHHNFGHNGPHDFHGVGINAKASELQAAMGLAVLNHFESIVEIRKQICNKYTELLSECNVALFNLRENTEWNYHYFPIIFETESKLLEIVKVLNDLNIYPRRYFYPSLNTVNYVKSEAMPVSEAISKRVLCLPLFTNLNLEDVELICNQIKVCLGR